MYSGDSNNNGTNSGCSSEPVTVGMQSPTLGTTANPTTEMVGAGPLADSATLSGGDNPGGTIDFYLFSPSQTCTASPGSGSYTFHQQFSVSGNGSYGPTTGGPTPNSAGTWHWLAVYSGDSNNNGTNSGCSSEPVIVSTHPTVLTTQANPTSDTVGSSTALSDSATLSAGVNPGGTIDLLPVQPEPDLQHLTRRGHLHLPPAVQRGRQRELRPDDRWPDAEQRGDLALAGRVLG